MISDTIRCDGLTGLGEKAMERYRRAEDVKENGR